jgi:hypothetical protein
MNNAEIPDSISDMDSIPATLSLSRSAGVAAVVAGVQATMEDFATALSTFTAAVDRLYVSINEFSAAIEVAELKEMLRR